MTRLKANLKRTTFGRLSRSELMSRIRSNGNATTELKFRKLLISTRITGWRRKYPLFGNPDFTFPTRRIVVFVDGCFWHGHSCGRNLTPKQNLVMWQKKFHRNKERDRVVSQHLKEKGWSVLRFWECELAKTPDVVVQRLSSAIEIRSK